MCYLIISEQSRCKQLHSSLLPFPRIHPQSPLFRSFSPLCPNCHSLAPINSRAKHMLIAPQSIPNNCHHIIAISLCYFLFTLRFGNSPVQCESVIISRVAVLALTPCLLIELPVGRGDAPSLVCPCLAYAVLIERIMCANWPVLWRAPRLSPTLTRLAIMRQYVSEIHLSAEATILVFLLNLNLTILSPLGFPSASS